MDVSGHKEAMESLRRLGAAGPKAAKKVFAAATARIVPRAKSLSPVDPVDGGQLRDSIRATRPTHRGNRVSAGVRAGGPDVPYAQRQHEDLTLRHTTGQAKFIEVPFLKEVLTVPRELIEEIDREVVRGGR